MKALSIVCIVSLLGISAWFLPRRPGAPQAGPVAAAHASKLNAAQIRIVDFLRNLPKENRPRAMVCFAPDAPQELIDAIEAAIYTPPEYQTTTSWTGAQASTLRWSVVPDGTPITGQIGDGNAPSNLQATLNGQVGAATWPGLYQLIINRWDGLISINYTMVTDDGAVLPSSAGSSARGDCRFSGHFLDGGGGVLAYDLFPPTGDMVIDTGDNWGSTSNNYRFLRNVLAHEHGHGLGLLHVCPTNSTHLMEPFIFTTSDGPLEDDIRGAQRLYGDADEPNDTTATATDLGTITNTTVTRTNISIDNNVSEQDFYKFTVVAMKQVSLTMTPVGSTYTSGPQVNPCSTGGTINGLTISNLSLELRDTNGTTVLASANSQPAGVAETIPNTVLAVGGGTYFAHVIPGATNDVQRYQLSITVSNAPPTQPGIASANPPTTNPFIAGPYRDVLDTGLGSTLTAGIGGAGTPPQAAVTYDPISVTFTFAPTTTPAPGNISVSCTDTAGNGAGDCPTVTAVSGSGAGPYLISLSSPIPPIECTTFTFAATLAGTKLQYQSLPGDTNMTGTTTGQDVLSLVSAINDGSASLPTFQPVYNINRTGGVTGQDVLRLVQLINGTNTTQTFNGAVVAACP